MFLLPTYTVFLFKLVNLRNHLLGVPPAQSLGAEADCLALLRSTAVLGIDWIMWVKYNYSLFSDCEKNVWLIAIAQFCTYFITNILLQDLVL